MEFVRLEVNDGSVSVLGTSELSSIFSVVLESEVLKKGRNNKFLIIASFKCTVLKT